MRLPPGGVLRIHGYPRKQEVPLSDMISEHRPDLEFHPVHFSHVLYVVQLPEGYR